MLKLLFAAFTSSTAGKLTASFSVAVWFKTAAISLATPIWLVASALFGVNPISKITSVSTPKKSLASLPIDASPFSTIIPSCDVPNPISSSAQIIPSET